ncbi:unnamed protein product [Arabidopsis thaliana]|uniref:(thale cress) hypothetical protein n=1 Tax=Arabidopsis thaliana TaxID=3702 RepID=A0A7G2E8N9_ARATH|nr:unnamed protein product [Arabidopsis thaliana]
MSLFFTPDGYEKILKISTRCTIGNTFAIIGSMLKENKKKWFRTNKQYFKHIWHMDRHSKNKVHGMLMLLMRTASTEKKRVCWFVVNDVPIRYSLREHALITGLDFHQFELDFNTRNFGSFDFVEKVYGTQVVNVKDVEDMLKSMEDECDGDQLRVAILLFLCTIVRGRRRFGSIHSFILKIVNDLEEVKKFSSGRNTFDDTMKEIVHLMKKRLDGKVGIDYLFPGFIIPLKVLAFECIPEMSKQFQKNVIGAKDESGEEALLLEIVGPFDDEDTMDHIADAWNERLNTGFDGGGETGFFISNIGETSGEKAVGESGHEALKKDDDVVETKPGFGNIVNEILRTYNVLGVVEKSVDDELRSGVKKSVDGELRSGDESSCLEKSVINNEPTSENKTGGEKRVHFFFEGSGFEKSTDDKSDEMACGDEVVQRKRNMRTKIVCCHREG